MTYNQIRCLEKNLPVFRRMLKRNILLHSVENRIPGRRFCTFFPGKYYETKYDEIRIRLQAVPCLDMLNRAKDSLQHDLWGGNDERLEDLQKWCRKVYSTNSVIAYDVGGIALLKAYCVYGFSIGDASWNQWDSERWRSVANLALCVDMFLLYYLIFDDVVDRHNIRGEEICWHKQPGIGILGMFDALAIFWSGFKLLRKHFAGLNCYTNLVEDFLQVNEEYAFGQVFESIIRCERVSRLSTYKMKNYEALAELKGWQLITRTPVHLAMHLAGGYSERDFEFTKKVSDKVATYMQIENDYSDFAYEKHGKKGSDIRNGSISWFSVNFLEEASDSMKAEFLKNYGIDDEKAVETVLALYKKTNMIERFHKYKNQILTEITDLIESRDDIKGAVFYDLLPQISKFNLPV